MNSVHEILSTTFTKTIKEYKDIVKLLDLPVKKFWETYEEEWKHFSNWDFSEDGEYIIVGYNYLDYNDDWEWGNENIPIDKVIEMIEPKFKVGDRVKDKRNKKWFVVQVSDKHFDISNIPGGTGYFVPIAEQDQYELVDDIEPVADKVELILGDYEVKVEGEKTYLVKKKHTYPKNYQECCDVLDVEPYSRSAGYKSDLITAFRNLLICRDAYWKIAGEEMGLGKPWKPDREDDTKGKYTIYTGCNEIEFSYSLVVNLILAFPSEKIRNAFYENFKDLIEQYKELL
ncbi:MAG: hypothetical protein IKU29_06275 [Parabacteroides sp.]|nr:hypothetical protein [Parabacteroides sp.]